MIDEAKRALGRHIYPCHAADELKRALKLGRDKCYQLLDQARADVVDSLGGRGADPLTAVYLFFESVMADATLPTKDRLAAASGIVKLLGLHRLTRNLDEGDVDGFLAGLMSAQLLRGNSARELNEAA